MDLNGFTATKNASHAFSNAAICAVHAAAGLSMTNRAFSAPKTCFAHAELTTGALPNAKLRPFQVIKIKLLCMSPVSQVFHTAESDCLFI